MSLTIGHLVKSIVKLVLISNFTHKWISDAIVFVCLIIFLLFNVISFNSVSSFLMLNKFTLEVFKRVTYE